MSDTVRACRRLLLFFAAVWALAACGGGGGGGSESPAETSPPPPVVTQPAPLSGTGAVRFLSQATFGPADDAVAALRASGLESWFLQQLEAPASLHLAGVLAAFPDDGFLDADGKPLPGLLRLPSDSFWRAAIEGEDQLRQRMAFALSQILVVSADSIVGRAPQAMAHYMDILTRGAFGNYRDLLTEVTYSPAMALYLTYLRNQKADAATGRVPDENYARELMQLFTIGLVHLNADGTPVLDGRGQEVEAYNNDDVTGLAKVFTGLSFAGASFNAPLLSLPAAALHSPLELFPRYHSPLPKHFLDVSIPANIDGEQSIAMALDGIFAHANVGPFIGRQLIQRFVTSAPEPGYVARVSAAFDSGRFTLPSGTVVGAGRRGDLTATLAAVLFDPQARDPAAREAPAYGKLREPVLRFTHWARAFRAGDVAAAKPGVLDDTSAAETLNQHPYRAPSVFNFYRPGYIAAGTRSGDAALTVPELQITGATSIVGYANFITAWALQYAGDIGADISVDYSAEIALADNPAALVDHLDRKLAHGMLDAASRSRMTQLVAALDGEGQAAQELRARVASVLVVTDPGYIVLR